MAELRDSSCHECRASEGGCVVTGVMSTMTPVMFVSGQVFRVQPGLTDNGAQRPTIQFLMVGYNDLCKGVVTAKDHMATTLAHDTKAVPFE